MRALLGSLGRWMLIGGLLFAGFAHAQEAHHRLVQTLYPLDEDATGNPASPPDSIWFGYAVAIRNSVALVGMPRQRDGGRVGVFVRSSAGKWNRTATLKEAGVSQFGRAIAYRDNTALVADIDAVFVYKLSNGVWRRTEKLVPPAADNVTDFGMSLTYQDGMAVVGARRAARGAVYVYRLSSAGKRLGMQRLQSSDGHTDDGFGTDVTMNSNTIVVGAPSQVHASTNTAAGAAYVFTRSNTTWRQTQKLTSTELDPGDEFGRSVAINNGMILIGAPRAGFFDGRFHPPYTEHVEGGSVYGFVLSGGSYAESLKLRPTTGNFQSFGSDIVMFDRIVAITGEDMHDPSGATLTPAITWTYTRVGSTVLPRASNWTGYAQASIALANNWLLVGTPWTDHRCRQACVGEAQVLDVNYLD